MIDPCTSCIEALPGGFLCEDSFKCKILKQWRKSRDFSVNIPEGRIIQSPCRICNEKSVKILIKKYGGFDCRKTCELLQEFQTGTKDCMHGDMMAVQIDDDIGYTIGE